MSNFPTLIQQPIDIREIFIFIYIALLTVISTMVSVYQLLNLFMFLSSDYKKIRTRFASGFYLVGATGLEPAASWSQTKHSTKLSYAPKCSDFIYYTILKENVKIILKKD